MEAESTFLNVSFCGDAVTARSARCEVKKVKTFVAPVVARFPHGDEHLLDSIEGLLRNHWHMHTLVQFALVLENAIVKRSAEQVANGRKGERFATQFSNDATLGEFLLDCRKRILAGGELLQDSFYFWKRLWVRFNGAEFGFVEIAERRFAGINSASHLLSNPSLNVTREVAHILIRDSKFERHHDHVVRWQIHTLECANLLNDSALKHADDFSSVIEVARDTMKRPAEDAIRFTVLKSAKHLVEDVPPWFFGTLAFVESRNDVQTSLPGDLVQLRVLSVNGEELTIFILTRFAAVDEIFEHGHILSKDINICEDKMRKDAHKRGQKELLRSLKGASARERFLHRLHSVALVVLRGFSASDAARLYGDSPRVAAYWVKRFEQKGVDGLREEHRSGRPTKLSPTQMKSLRSFLQEAARKSELVTGKMLAAHIHKRFGVSLTIRQSRRILKKLNGELATS